MESDHSVRSTESGGKLIVIGLAEGCSENGGCLRVLGMGEDQDGEY